MVPVSKGGATCLGLHAINDADTLDVWLVGFISA